MERWELGSAFACAGCAFLAGRVFPAGIGPQPGDVHPNCRCRRVPVNLDGMRGAAIIGLSLDAWHNARNAAALLAEARRLSRAQPRGR